MDHIYRCKSCKSEFRVSEELLNPLNKEHGPWRPYCPDCDSDILEDTGVVKYKEPSLDVTEEAK